MEASGRAYTEALSELYPTRADVAAEIAELEGRLTLPRSTELFASDIHGEYNAFSHVLRGGFGKPCVGVFDVFQSVSAMFGRIAGECEQRGFLVVVQRAAENLLDERAHRA